MNKLILLFGVLICLVAVHARNYNDRSVEEPEDRETSRPRDRIPRHRRRRWQSNYGYDYSPPSNYYPDRRDGNQEVIQNIYRLLEDISAYIRRTPPPPPPPQPIYIPYPVPFPTRVNIACRKPSQNATKDPIPTRRFPTMDDTNQNWGFEMPVEDYSDDGSDGARPISFEPLGPKQLMTRPAPQVEHGSQNVAHTTVPPKFEAAPPSLAASSSSFKTRNAELGMCNAAILSCCGLSTDMAEQRQCFVNIGCGTKYNDGNACTSQSIKKALDSFKNAYAPVQ